MAEKSRLLSKRRHFLTWAWRKRLGPSGRGAASYEERIAPLLDLIGRDAEAALHRIAPLVALRSPVN